MDGWVCSGEVSFPLEMTNVGLVGFVLSCVYHKPLGETSLVLDVVQM